MKGYGVERGLAVPRRQFCARWHILYGVSFGINVGLAASRAQTESVERQRRTRCVVVSLGGQGSYDCCDARDTGKILQV